MWSMEQKKALGILERKREIQGRFPKYKGWETAGKFISLQADNKTFWLVGFLFRVIDNGIYRIL